MRSRLPPASTTHALALRQNGTVVAWGNNQFGKLGDGTTTTRLTPVAVTGLTNVVAIAAGQAHSLALTSSGQVWAWGSGFHGQLGQNTTVDQWTPVALSSLANVTAIAAGAQHSVVLVDAQVWVWGSNTGGQLGQGASTANQLLPILVPGLTPIASIAASRHQTYAFAADGGLYAWRGNTGGELGDGSTENRRAPTVLAEAGGAWPSRGSACLAERTRHRRRCSSHRRRRARRSATRPRARSPPRAIRFRRPAASWWIRR